jgi:alpha-N-arabinofuranosidase
VRQTIYYPYAWALAYARGQVLDLSSEGAAYDAPTVGRVPFVDVAGTMDPSTGDIALFVLNRDVANARELRVTWRDAPPVRVVAAEVLTGRDLKASNTFEAPSTVVPQRLDMPRAGAEMTFEIPARAYALIRLAQR